MVEATSVDRLSWSSFPSSILRLVIVPPLKHLSSSPGNVPRGSSSKYILVLGVEIGATATATTSAKGFCRCCCCTRRRSSGVNENCEDDDDDDDDGLPETRESDPGNGGASPPCASSSSFTVMDVCSPEGGRIVVGIVGVWRLTTALGGEEAGMLRLPRETGLTGGGFVDLRRREIGGDRVY